MIPQDAPKPASIRHFSDSLPMLLLRAREAVMLRFRAMLRRQGLTEQQWRVLRALATEDAFEIPDLVASTFLLAPSLSRILADLRQGGLISVEAPAADQRRRIVRLTPDGARRIAEIGPLSEEIYAEITARIGAARLGEIQTLLRDMEDALRPEADIRPEPKGPARQRRRKHLTR